MEYKRIMLKISGQALGGEDGTGIDSGTLERVCGEIAGMVEAGKEVAVVMGAGNFFRGVQGVAGGMDRVRSDQMGMIATLMNALALQDGLLRAGMQPIVMSAYETGTVVMPYNAHTGRMSLSKGKIVLCAAGTGNPFFTTDTAASIRALELKCDIMFKTTMVDGVYDKDPKKHTDAVRFDAITYDEVLERRLKVMDLTAITLARESDLPILVLKMDDGGAIIRAAMGETSLGTLITAG